MKATGAEITEFWKEWPPGDDWYIDDGFDVLDEHDQPLLDPKKKYDVSDLGVLVWQGKGPSPAGLGGVVPVQTVFAKWRKARTHQTFTVSVPNEAVDEFKALCERRGWKV